MHNCVLKGLFLNLSLFYRKSTLFTENTTILAILFCIRLKYVRFYFLEIQFSINIVS